MASSLKILLLGKNGQLGQEIAAKAAAHGFELFAYGHDDLDITDLEKVKKEFALKKPDFVVNTAAYHVVPDCEIYPSDAFAVNTVAVFKLAQVCKELGIRFVTYSTDYVFDGKKGTPYIETDVPNPVQIYGLSKLAGEFACLNAAEDALVIRTCGVYGGASGSRSKKGNFVLSILRATEEKKELEVACEQIVNPTFAGDLADASLQLFAKNPDGGVYHLANSGFCSWADFAAAIVQGKNRPTKIIPVDRSGMSGAMKRPLFSAIANTKAKALGVDLPSWQEGLTRYLKTLA